MPASLDRRRDAPAGAVASAGVSYSIVHLADVEDQAPKFGFGDVQEARFPRRDLDAESTGLAHLRIKPGQRTFAHRHGDAEEVYVVLSGSGRIKVGDDVHELRPLDAVRLSPDEVRALEAGPDGLEYLAFGARHAGDAELVQDFWP